MDAAALEGTWDMVRAEFAGEEAPELAVCKTILELTPFSYAVRFDGCISDEGAYAIGVWDGQKTLTLAGVTGTNAGRTIPAIFQLVGDRLRVCYGFDGVLPSAFATHANTHLYLASYRRRAR